MIKVSVLLDFHWPGRDIRWSLRPAWLQQLASLHTEKPGHFGQFGWSGIMRGAGVDFLRVYRIRCSIDGGAGGEEPAEGHAHRDSGIAGDLHGVLHRGGAGVTGLKTYTHAECARLGGGGHDATGCALGQSCW